MLIKTIGAVLVLTSATAIGSLLALRIKEQEGWLADIKMSLFLLLGELEYHQMPLPEALCQTAVKHSGRMSCFYRNTGEELEKKTGGNVRTIWQKQAELILKEAPLNAAQKEEFSRMGIYFSGTDVSARKNAVEYYFARLEEDIVRLRSTGKDKAYLYRMLGMLGGVFLLVLVS